MNRPKSNPLSSHPPPKNVGSQTQNDPSPQSGGSSVTSTTFSESSKSSFSTNNAPTTSISTSRSFSTDAKSSSSKSSYSTKTIIPKIRRKKHDTSNYSLHGSRDASVEPSSDDLFPTEFVLLSMKNRKIIATNIRHFQVFFWILLFARGTLQLGYLSIVHRLLMMPGALFSASVMTPFLFPCAMVSINFSFGHILVTHLKVAKMRSMIIHKIYNFSFVVMLLVDLAMLIATGTELYLNLGTLEDNMMTTLNRSLNLGVMSKEFHVMQKQRNCCGVHGPEDWQAVEKSKILLNWNTNLSAYPSSCCSNEVLFDDAAFCTSENVWKTGCYKMESHWIITYCGWYIALVGIGLILNILTAVHVRRLYNYCKKYRPHWVMPEKTGDPKDETNSTNTGVGDS